MPTTASPMQFIPLTQGRFAIVDDDDYEFVSQWKWCGHKIGRTFYADRTSGHQLVYMHVEILKHYRDWIPGRMVDHRNMCGLDNRKENLRVATKGQNSQNRGPTRRNKTGIVGVSWDKRDSKWYACIMVNGSTINLGFFPDIQDAIAAREQAEVKYFGDFRYNPLATCPLGVGCPDCFPRVAHLLPPELDCDWDSLC